MSLVLPKCQADDPGPRTHLLSHACGTALSLGKGECQVGRDQESRKRTLPHCSAEPFLFLLLTDAFLDWRNYHSPMFFEREGMSDLKEHLLTFTQQADREK